MRFLIFRETPFSTAMSIFGAIFVGMGLVVGGFAFDIMFNEMDAKGSVGYWIVALAFAAVGVVFYIAAYKNQKKAMERRLETEREYAAKKFNFGTEEEKR